MCIANQEVTHMLLHKLSTIDCSSEEEEHQHAEEVNKIIDSIAELPEERCILEIQYLDEVHKGKNIEFESTTYNFLEDLEFMDFKNGIDFHSNDDGTYIMFYGQGYTYKGLHYLIEARIDIRIIN